MNIPGDDSRTRNESDREDIMREATALKRRASFSVTGLPEPIVAGFRANNYFSVFFDQDPVYQFDSDGRLRRAYRSGLLYRTQGHTLARLERVRTEEQTVLKRDDLRPDQLREFLTEMTAFIKALHDALENRTTNLLQQIPKDEHLHPYVTTALRTILYRETERLAPPLPTRRQ